MALNLSQSPNGCSCSCNKPSANDPSVSAGVYNNSSQVNAKSTIQVVVPTEAGDPMPTSIVAQLTFNGITQAAQTFNVPANLAPGTPLTLAVQAANPIHQTGRYGWQLKLLIADRNRATFAASGPLYYCPDRGVGRAGWEGHKSCRADGSGRLASMTGTDGAYSTFNYQNGLLASIAVAQSAGGPLMRTYNFTHDPSGNLTSMTNPDGSVYNFSYDADSHLTGESLGDETNTWTYQDGELATIQQGSAPPASLTPANLQGINGIVAGGKTGENGKTGTFRIVRR